MLSAILASSVDAEPRGDVETERHAQFRADAELAPGMSPDVRPLGQSTNLSPRHENFFVRFSFRTGRLVRRRAHS